MYLARKMVNGSLQYFIRETYRDGDLLRSRDLFDLGPNPARYIIYPGGNSFYIDEVIEDPLDEPQFLDQLKVDAYFIEEICRLNDDLSFWAGMEKNDGLHEYLIRYAIMFFDFDYTPRNFMEEYVRRFINSRRDYQPLRRSHVAVDEASSIFAVAKSSLQKLNRAQLARLFRRRAMKLHPDKGGDHDTFVKLTEAYHSLLRSKK